MSEHLDDLPAHALAPSAEPDAHTTLSSLRESVVNASVLAQLMQFFWCQGRRDVEQLNAAVDFAGYDHVLDWEGIMRHIQFKSSFRGSTTAEVNLNCRLALKPSGCVIWTYFDRHTLELGPFLWFGGAPGQRLPPLGDKVGQHSRGEPGAKGERAEIRVVGKGRFRRFDTIAELAAALFGDAEAGPPSALVREAAHRELLVRHLRRQARHAPISAGLHAVWLKAAQQGQFSTVPETLDEGTLAAFAHLVNGTRLAREACLGDLQDFCGAITSEGHRTGKWSGTALELWLVLHGEHRRLRESGHSPSMDEQARLVSLFDALRRKLIAGHDEAAGPSPTVIGA